MTTPLVTSRWPHLQFTDTGRTRFDEVVAFLDNLEIENHPHRAEIRADFIDRLDFLDAYGGAISEGDGRRRFRVALGRDWAPHSFSVVWEQLDLQSGTYRYAFNGGLIWHGGPDDPLCVSLTPQWFGIHT